MMMLDFPAGPFDLIVADPPWHFATRSAKGITSKGAGGQYETMTLAQIKAMPVPLIAAEDSLLWLWATNPMLPQAFAPWVPLDIQRYVKYRDGDVCSYCGATDGPFHLDHIIPWSLGGASSVDNLAVSCAACNWSKGKKTLEEWRQSQ